MLLWTLPWLFTFMLSECFKLGANDLLKVQFDSNVQLEENESVLAISPFGGSLATSWNQQFYIKNADGKVQLRGFLSASDGLIAGWWNEEQADGEQLCLLFADGRVFRIKSEVDWEVEQLQESELIEAKPQGSGLFVLNTSNRFVYYGHQMRKRVFASPGCLQFNSPQCWCPIDSRKITFAVENRIFLCTSDEVFERSCSPYGTICQLAVKGGKIVALTVDGRCLVFEASESLEVLLDISVEFGVLQMDQFKMIDGICVAIQSSSGRVSFVDLEKEIGTEFSLNFNEVIEAVGEECDGIRLITRKKNWMVVKMPAAIQSPPHLDASSSVQERVKALEEASTCLLELSFEARLQESTIEACQTAMRQLKGELNEDTFAYISATLQRRLDACKLFSKLQKHFHLTPAQFKQLGKKMLKRMCQRDLHFEAFQLAIGLEWDMSELLTDWSIKMMKQKGQNEKQLTTKVMDKLMTWSPHRAAKVEYLRLAEEAIRLQLNSLASRLLQQCATSREKIELLVKFDAYEEALKAAVETAHPGEIKFVLDCLMKRLSLTVFLQLAHISEKVKKALYEYCQVNQPVLQQILLYQDDRLDELLASKFDREGDKVLELGKWFKMLRVQRCFEKRAGGGVSLLGLSREECLEKLKVYKLSSDFQESLK